MAENPQNGFSQRNLRIGDSSLQFQLRSSEETKKHKCTLATSINKPKRPENISECKCSTKVAFALIQLGILCKQRLTRDKVRR
jgi:hypothetical protein